METVLKEIAKQANLDRVLFTPSMKKIYFDMAVAAGGAMMFKHADSVRNGLAYAVDKADDKKHALLFCAAHELVHAYDLLGQISHKLVPVVVLALRDGLPEEQRDHGSFLRTRDCGWIQFLTHTNQEVYDHLALAYHAIAEKELKVPMLILHSTLTAGQKKEIVFRTDLNLGNPLTGLQSARAGKKVDFAAALAAVQSKGKKEKPTLSSHYAHLLPLLRELYHTLEYDVPEEGFPFHGGFGEGDTAIVSVIPPEEYEDDPNVCRPYCLRPGNYEAIAAGVQKKKKVVIVEPTPAVGTVIPPFYGEMLGALGQNFKGQVISVTVPETEAVLSRKKVEEIRNLAGTATALS